MEFNEILSRSDYTHKDCVELFKITHRTLRNWIKYGAPHYAHERLSLSAGVHPDWQGIRFYKNRLYTNNGYSFNRNQLETIVYLSITQERLVRVLEKRIEALECELSKIIKNDDFDADKPAQETREYCTL